MVPNFCTLESSFPAAYRRGRSLPSAGRVLTSHFGWHDRSRTSAGLWRSDGSGRLIVTAGPCVSLRLIRGVSIFAQVSYAARRSEAEPHWSNSDQGVQAELALVPVFQALQTEFWSSTRKSCKRLSSRGATLIATGLAGGLWNGLQLVHPEDGSVVSFQRDSISLLSPVSMGSITHTCIRPSERTPAAVADMQFVLSPLNATISAVTPVRCGRLPFSVTEAWTRFLIHGS